jgi:hypothetical protein
VDVVSPHRFIVSAEGHELAIPLERSHPLDSANGVIDRAIIVIHGSSRNSDDYYARIRAAAEDLSVAGRTLIIAPQFLSEADIEGWNLPTNTLYWGGGWRQGDHSLDTIENSRPASLSSYAIVDAMIDQLSSPALFPNLEWIVLAGHSAGGQFVNRFAVGSPSEDVHPEISFRYLVSNPSSYLYFNDDRPNPSQPGRFSLPSVQQIFACPDFDEYKYGFRDLNPYMRGGVPTEKAVRYATREVQYVIGALDTESDGLDLDCAAMLQGSQRLDRALSYFEYITWIFGTAILDRHTLRLVPGVGHSAGSIFASATGRDALFGPSPSLPTPPPTVPAVGLVGRALLVSLLLAYAARRVRRDDGASQPRSITRPVRPRDGERGNA